MYAERKIRYQTTPQHVTGFYLRTIDLGRIQWCVLILYNVTKSSFKIFDRIYFKRTHSGI